MALVYEFMSEGTLQEHIDGIYSIFFLYKKNLIPMFCNILYIEKVFLQ
jgi:hypothetical protein